MRVRPLGLEYLAWARQASVDRRGWVAAAEKGLGQAELDAFAEGVRQGYLDAVAALKLHGHLISSK